MEKHQGYHYEHCFSYNWNAMRGYHYLMHLAHLLNTLAVHTLDLAEKVLTLGIRGLLHFLRQTVSGPWLDAQRIRTLVATRTQLRLV